MKKIAIRADGGSNIGLGHIMRTLVLAREIAKVSYVFYICKDDEEYQAGINIVSHEFDIVKISVKDFWNEKCIKADILITDSYDVDSEYFNETSKRFDKCIYIDDMNLYDFSKLDFVINQNYGAEKIKYSSSTSTKFLCGTRYTLLRDEFRDVEKVDILEEMKRVAITLGGADIMNMTPKIMEYLVESELEVHVIVTSNFKKLDEINEIKKKYPNKFCIHMNPKISQILSQVDLVISAAGSTLYEASIVGVPILAIIVADNQLELANNMNIDNLIVSLGWHRSLSKSKLLKAIKDISSAPVRKLMQENQNVIKVDGVLNIIDVLYENGAL